MTLQYIAMHLSWGCASLGRHNLVIKSVFGQQDHLDVVSMLSTPKDIRRRSPSTKIESKTFITNVPRALATT